MQLKTQNFMGLRSSVLLQAKQLRANSRHKTVMEKRLVGIDGTPPHLIVSTEQINYRSVLSIHH